MSLYHSSKILVFTNSKRETESIEMILAENGSCFTSFIDQDNFVSAVNNTTSLIVLAREALSQAMLEKIRNALHNQPDWSQIPVILLANANTLATDQKNSFSIENCILLERPLHKKSFLSIVKSCVEAREKQFEIHNLKLRLKKALDDMQVANKTKHEFLSNMSHEIRTPLGAVIGFSELICQPRLTKEEREEYCMIVRRNSQALSSLIDDLLDLSKLENGELNIYESDVALDEILNEVVGSLYFKSQLKNVPIYIEKSSSVPSEIRTDSMRLKQILNNLIGNALKFTSAGHITIKVTDYHLNATDNDNKLLFEVTDSGMGIAPENHFKLFQAFFQVDGSSTRKFGGTGLGLALSRQLARALGGDLRLKSSTLGQGSTFQFSVRYKPCEQKQKPKAKAASLKGLKVLVADDSVDNQTLISRILTKEGAQVEIVDNGEDAVKKALEQNFNVVLMDVQMPILSGLEATAELRKHGYPKPIVALSAYAMAEDRIKGLSAGCDLYLTKPIDKNNLLNFLQNYVQ